MRITLFAVLLLTGAALAACSGSAPSKPAESAASTEALPPPEAETRATPEAGAVEVPAPVAGAGEEPPAADTGWAKEGVTPEQHRADIESCYAYAWSQVQRDLNIDSDIDSARFDDDSGLGFNQLTARMDAYDAKNRRVSLMNACMEAKGYARV